MKGRKLILLGAVSSVSPLGLPWTSSLWQHCHLCVCVSSWVHGRDGSQIWLPLELLGTVETL